MRCFVRSPLPPPPPGNMGVAKGPGTVGGADRIGDLGPDLTGLVDAERDKERLDRLARRVSFFDGEPSFCDKKLMQ